MNENSDAFPNTGTDGSQQDVPTPIIDEEPDQCDPLRKIGKAVVERVDEEGFTEENFAACPICGRAREFALAHDDDCPISEALEGEDG